VARTCKYTTVESFIKFTFFFFVVKLKMAMLYKKPEISKEPISPPPSLAEFIKTEKEYVAKLEAIFKMYLQPTEQYKYLPLMITQEDVFSIISNIVIIMKIHTQFLKNLTALSEKPPEEQLVGALFVEFEPNLKKYRSYVNSIENGLRSLCLRIITSDNIDAFLKKSRKYGNFQKWSNFTFIP